MRSSLRVFFCLTLVLLAVGNQNARAGQMVAFEGYPAGSIVVKTGQRRLYYVLDGKRALRFPVAVGRQQHQWRGRTYVARKLRNPVWVPPAVVRRDKPHLPAAIPPGPRNPLGAAVFVLATGTYGIHGTNNPGSIGREASYGCFRMQNADILALYGRVNRGTPVFVEQ